MQHFIFIFSVSDFQVFRIERFQMIASTLTLSVPKTYLNIKNNCFPSTDMEKVWAIICLLREDIPFFILWAVMFRYKLYRIFGGPLNISSEFLGSEGVKGRTFHPLLLVWFTCLCDLFVWTPVPRNPASESPSVVKYIFPL